MGNLIKRNAEYEVLVPNSRNSDRGTSPGLLGALLRVKSIAKSLLPTLLLIVLLNFVGLCIWWVERKLGIWQHSAIGVQADARGGQFPPTASTQRQTIPNRTDSSVYYAAEIMVCKGLLVKLHGYRSDFRVAQDEASQDVSVIEYSHTHAGHSAEQAAKAASLVRIGEFRRIQMRGVASYERTDVDRDNLREFIRLEGDDAGSCPAGTNGIENP